MNLWPHQRFAVKEVQRLVDAGQSRLCVTSPTGGGKSLIMGTLMQWANEQRWPTALYTDRTMLFDQLSGQLDSWGIEHGKIASAHKPALLRDVQLCMLPTVNNRVYKQKKWELPRARLVLLDEAHRHTADTARRVIDDHIAKGAVLVGMTATPLDLSDIYQQLIVAGTTSELRECGALLPCETFAPDEPDAKELKRQATGEYTEGSVRKTIMTSTICARVISYYRKLNPDQKPAVLFAPGVKESRWFARQFCEAGIPAAHIDGDSCWLDGEEFPATQEVRDHIAARSKSGSIKVVCNRFVLREGIDWPWLYHGILATIFGSVASYLQACGRFLRNHPDLDHVILQDHGGNWWRHGDVNDDRLWILGETAYHNAVKHDERLREKKEREPLCCPQCQYVRISGPSCPACGFKHAKSERMVIQRDGTLKRMTGDVFRKIPRREQPNTQELWERYYWGAKKKGIKTFRGVEAWFFQNERYFPPRTLNFMPRDDADWVAKVCDVPFDGLQGYDEQTRRVKSARQPKAAPTAADDHHERMLF